MGLIVIDLDHFKLVNDTRGHDAGDALLRAVGARLRECVREHDLVAHLGEREAGGHLGRLGGDEFALVLPEVQDREEAAEVGRRAAEMVAAWEACNG